MRLSVTLNDGRIITYGGRPRYVAFRLTRGGGFAINSGSSAEECVAFARNIYEARGFPAIVVDTVNAEAIAAYPYDEQNLPKGQKDVRFHE